MGCIYSDFEGKCTLYTEGVESPGTDEDDNGYCVCEDDEDPLYTCAEYEEL